MLKNEKHYFMTNKDWFYYDVKLFKYVLTDKAPQKAIDSYKKYYNELLEEYDVEDIKGTE